MEPSPTSLKPCFSKTRCMRWLWESVEPRRSEEHTSELQSRQYLVCRLLLEKKIEAQRLDLGPADRVGDRRQDVEGGDVVVLGGHRAVGTADRAPGRPQAVAGDRQSTRLNSS